MDNIKKVRLYFANPQQGPDGEALMSEPPESHELSWHHIQSKAMITLSTGECLSVETNESQHLIVKNAFYFGSGSFGSLLGVNVHYEDESNGVPKEIVFKSEKSEHIDIVLKDFLNTSFESIINQKDWKGYPCIGEQSDFIELSIKKKEIAEEEVTMAASEYSDISLSPSLISIFIGETATFDAVHTYSGTPTWTYDSSLEVLEKTNKRIRVRPKALGSYEIKYSISGYEEKSVLYVGEPTVEWVDPDEPEAPALPNTPPTEAELVEKVIQLVDASVPVKPLYKYPNIMKRNARYRGPRESEKYLSNHQEEIYEIRQIYKDLDLLSRITNKSINSWFNEVEINSITMKYAENVNISNESQDISKEDANESIRAFNDNMLQLSGNNLEDRIVGIYGIKRRMQELDERIAEAERRYRDYENAYK